MLSGAPGAKPSLTTVAQGASAVAARGAWLACLAAGLELLAENAQGTGKGSGRKGNRSDLQVVGFGTKNRDAILRWAKDRLGSTTSARQQRRAA